MITTTASSYKSCDLQELKMAGKRNIVESWLEVLAGSPGSSPSSSLASNPGSSPGSIYRHPQFWDTIFITIQHVSVKRSAPSQRWKFLT